jgi:hypothetical protein
MLVLLCRTCPGLAVSLQKLSRFSCIFVLLAPTTLFFLVIHTTVLHPFPSEGNMSADGSGDKMTVLS